MGIDPNPARLCFVCGARTKSRFKYCSKECFHSVSQRSRPHNFWKVRVEPTGCWIFAGYISHLGYGQLYAEGRLELAHRWAWKLTHGDIPDGLFVCHRCDNKPCINPEHLFLGTTQDNTADKVAKGRCARTFGEQNGYAKLTERAVAEIRQRFARKSMPSHQKMRSNAKELAVEYGVCASHIRQIANGRAWMERSANR